MHVGIVLGSRSQWSTMQHTVELLAKLGIACEARIITANKSYNQLHNYAGKAIQRGLEVIIAGSAGTAYLPGILASKTELPVLDVPMNHTKNNSTVNSKSTNKIGHPVVVLTTGTEGATNAALFAANMLANKYPHIRKKLHHYHTQNT
jgi:5-(carboxyamino)imidazole ribonucleotide mutase